MGRPRSRTRAHMIAGAVLLAGLLASAEPPRLVVRPQGTNQLQLAAAFLQTNVSYLVMARSNGPYAHWVGLTWLLAGSNASTTLLYNLSEARQSKGLQGLSIRNLRHWTFVVGSGEDRTGNGLPEVYEELALRSDPYGGADSYADPDGDGWANLQEYQNGTDPLRWDAEPPGPSGVSVREFTNHIIKVTWSQWGGAMPDYFVIEKGQRTLQPGNNVGPFLLQPPAQPNRTNMSEYLARQREIQRRFGRPFSRIQDAFYVTGQFRAVARVPARQGQHDYSYTETNSARTPTYEMAYRIRAHYTPPLQACLDRVDATAIRQTLMPITAQPTPTGYDLTAPHPIPYAWYLLLVRDRNNPHWRASGYFTSGTNRDPVHLQVDAKGMMHGGQSPIALPEVKFLPDVVAPEFAAGWGEDSDGDGLPDIYEVLVMGTDPLKADTGDTGILDGYKEPAHDGWSNLEKFRRRVNPSTPFPSPAAVELQRPTLMDLWQALATRAPRTDLHYEPTIFMRRPGEAAFRPMDEDLRMSSYAANLRDPRNAHFDFDVRIAWGPPRPHPRPTGYSGP